MGILFNEVDRKDLRAGDHIYSWRTGYTYAHHGIFVGDDDVVHFTRGSGQELGEGVSLNNSFVSSSIPKQHLSCTNPTGNCGFQNGNNGVIRSCLNCFLDGGAVHRFKYGVSKAVFFAQVRGGTCTFAQPDPPDEVIHRAMYLHKHGFGNYNLISNNCEDFAIYCRTGYIVKRRGSGGSGQVAAMDGVRSASGVEYDFRDILNTTLSLAFVIGTYLYKRYEADIGVRVDKAKVPVEDLATFLDSSTRIGLDKTKVPVEDSSVYPASSTGSSVDKAKVRVEDVAVIIDSFTGKKLPLQDLAVDLDSSTGIGLDKTKVPVEDSSVYPASSTGSSVDKAKVRVEDVAVILDSFTGKRLPLQDLAVDLDSSTGIRPDKTKVPVEDSSVYPASSTGSSVDKAKVRVEDVAVILDSFTGKKLQLQELAVDLDSSTGIRLDKTTVPVEDSAIHLESTGIRVDKMKAPVGSSTGKKPPAEDLAAYSDSSTAIFVDKSKVPVEGEDLFLDSSTFKKNSADESSTSQEISRKRSSKKQKKKLRQQQRRNFELMQEVEDVPQFPDSSTGKKPPAQSVAVSFASSTDKKPPVAESSSSPAISRNRNSRKQKKNLRQQQRRTCQSVECPNRSGPILQGN